MGAANGWPLQLWLTFWRLAQRYWRYSVEGLERLDTPRSALVVGYHGRPVAWDMCMLTVALYDRLGYLGHAMLYRMLDDIPATRRVMDGLGFLTGDDERLAAVVARGEHILITPGGGREACRGFRQRYQVCWGDHRGYLRLAVKYDLPIVPVGCSGVDDAYVGLNDAYRLGRRLGLPGVWASIPWFGVGPLGLCPFSPPFPVRMRQLIGEPIEPHADGKVGLDDRRAMDHLHRRVTGAVQALLDRARGRASIGAR
jgi:1-acyl-sn-glycerol-3-phosphate acyltransferase